MTDSLSHQDWSEASLIGLIAYFVRDGLLDVSAASSALEEAARQNIPLITYLVRSGRISSEAILASCAKHFTWPVYDLTDYDSVLLDNSRLNAEVIHRYRVLPLRQDEHSLDLGLTDPTRHAVISMLGFHTGLRIYPMLVSEALLDKILKAHARAPRFRTQLESALAKIPPVEEQSGAYEIHEQDADDGPVSEFVTSLISDAIEKRVSDIHIEPFMQNCRIRFRRDGLLYEAAAAPAHFAARMITRLKLISHLNIAERRLPQDGRLRFPPYPHIDVRVSTCPTLRGEKMVMRILDTAGGKKNLDTLGLTSQQQLLLTASLDQPQGLILVTGPTGSGKTSTLYAALHYLNRMEKNISSVEDPVEIEMPGINQINVNPRVGLDFVTVLRSLLRQDPDILMIGEIRDLQTAAIAVQAAQTGHLVLSTLHTNSAVETIMRLQGMGIAPYHFISSVSLIIAQRLVRKLCDHCKKTVRTGNRHSQPAADCESGGCDACHQGYQGRTGIFECLPITKSLASLILSGVSAMELTAAVRREKWMTLREAGLEKIHAGITTRAELARAIRCDDPALTIQAG
ncbi:putative type II secretion system protein HxcR [Aquicella siphonis]|uniref:Putative type II secretion system protein HxcR n=1 Tax=Aquicella siphonis TaxID=254247 RepID=A0A5E4PG42_9COXI|nr:ATPase, T2SS/T4P/T4SS family [Aquicella siphonis]VVC75341.1 putative type II secretion system protein HxcR [Aquicella siphonis]